MKKLVLPFLLLVGVCCFTLAQKQEIRRSGGTSGGTNDGTGNWTASGTVDSGLDGTASVGVLNSGAGTPSSPGVAIGAANNGIHGSYPSSLYFVIGGADKVGIDASGLSVFGGASISGAATALSYASPKVAIVQSGTNCVVNLAAGDWQFLSATNDLYFTASGFSATKVLQVTVEIQCDTTNRNIYFDPAFSTNGVGAPVTDGSVVLSSNKFAWLTLVSTTGTNTGVRVLYSTQMP